MREVASIVVLCELAEELSGGGRLDELRSQLAQLRITEQTPGIEDGRGRGARARACDRRAAAGRVARVPRRRSATRRAKLERALGDVDSPFASALRSSTGAVDGFLAEVETRYRLPLS